MSAETSAANDDDVVPLVPLDRRRNPWNPRTLPIAIADDAINLVRAGGADLRLTNGDLHVQEAGLWRTASRGDLQWLRCVIEQAAEAYGERVKLGTVIAAWRRLNAHPGLLVRTPPKPCPVAEWTRVALTQADEYKIDRVDLLAGFHGWLRQEMSNDGYLPNPTWVIPKLRKAAPFAKDVRTRNGRFFGNIRFVEEGLKYWTQQRVYAAQHGHGSRGISPSAEYVNQPWDGKGWRFARALPSASPQRANSGSG
jgi:hypothetical protein